jgi:hypothetical protein
MAVTDETIKALEWRIGELERQFREALMESIKDRSELRKMLREIHEAQLKQRTFVGGIMFAISSLWAIAIAVWEILKTRS